MNSRELAKEAKQVQDGQPKAKTAVQGDTTKRRVQGKGEWPGRGHHGPTVATATDRGGCHSQTVVLSPEFFVFCAAFHFFTWLLSVQAANLSLKGCICLQKGARFHYLSFWIRVKRSSLWHLNKRFLAYLSFKFSLVRFNLVIFS